MADHAGQTPNKPAKPEPSTKSASATPARPDPHAGHDMGKPVTPAKGAGKK